MSLPLSSLLDATRCSMFQIDEHCLATSLAIIIIFIMSTEQIIGDVDASYLDRHCNDTDIAANRATLPPHSSRLVWPQPKREGFDKGYTCYNKLNQ
ncbi:hypothetical protein SK128_019940 [Halocaridina rubra]|uniref:Uncharacterized protein n=1 Tax=Halocaridina rubra TaxID=373956 RepID=A0AAN8X268_HALRR